jgi:hypothetical protein
MRDFPIPGHMEVLMTLVQSVIRRLTNSLCPREESMAGHMGINGVYLKLGKGNTKGSMVGPRWNLEAERVCSAFQVLLKPTLTYGKGRTR